MPQKNRDKMAILFEKRDELIHIWLKLDLGGNMDETNPSFLGLYFHPVVVSRWFHVVDDVQGWESEGRVKMVTDVHG